MTLCNVIPLFSGVPTISNQDCQTTTSHAANQFSNDLQCDPDPFSLQGKFKITDVVDIMALSHLTT